MAQVTDITVAAEAALHRAHIYYEFDDYREGYRIMADSVLMKPGWTMDIRESFTLFPENIEFVVQDGTLMLKEEQARFPISSISELKRGDIITNAGSGTSYIVDAVYDDRAIAVRTIQVTNPSEWRVFRDNS